MNLVSSVLSTAIGLVFLFAVSSKLRHPKAFQDTIAGYRIVPHLLVPGAAVMIMALESFVAVAFLTGWQLNAALPVSVIILLTFVGAISVNLYRHTAPPCGCFGDPGERISTQTLLRVLLLLAAVSSIIAVSFSAPTLSIWAVLSLNVGLGLQVCVLAVALILFTIWGLQLPRFVALLRGVQELPSDSGRREAY